MDILDFYKEVYDQVPDWVQDMYNHNISALEKYTHLRNEILINSNHLAKKEKELILVGINAARRYEKSMIFHTKEAIDSGANVDEIAEIILTCVLSRGIPAWLEGVKAIKYAKEYLNSDYVNGDKLISEIEPDLDQYFQEEFGQTPEWANIMSSYNENALTFYSKLRQSILNEGNTSRKLKELVLIGINVSERYQKGVEIHVASARKYGATDQELSEVYLTSVLTAGIPAWFEGSGFFHS